MISELEIIDKLTPIHGGREAILIADMLLEKLTGLRKRERSMNYFESLSVMQLNKLEQWMGELLQHRPIQYVINEAWFQNMKFRVDERVLIPRPETEELVEWIVKEATNRQPLTILDIGTGSGCIPISLKMRLSGSVIHTCDISSGALELAKANAENLGAAINFHQLDFLSKDRWNTLPAADIVVSNPPYIPQSGHAMMDKHVVEYEPSLALFVPDEDALVFYKAIGAYVKEKCIIGSKVYVEIHEDLGEEVKKCFEAAGLTDVIIKKDMQGKERMVRAER